MFAFFFFLSTLYSMLLIKSSTQFKMCIYFAMNHLVCVQLSELRFSSAYLSSQNVCAKEEIQQEEEDLRGMVIFYRFRNTFILVEWRICYCICFNFIFKLIAFNSLCCENETLASKIQEQCLSSQTSSKIICAEKYFDFVQLQKSTFF